MSPVVEIRGLTKTYRRWRGTPRQALAGFDMEVLPGQVHGFLGPNGSGKTTTLRILLGLAAADGGEMRLFGKPVPAALPEVMDQVGAIVESPQFFGSLSGRDTLSLLATAGRIPQTRVDEVLELVGLRDRARDKVRAYSLGMRQRLAVGSALLKRPRLLVLDEPANGLDPAGIREMRDLMRNLAAEGMTVLLSSHILAEVQQICDAVTIITLGRRVAAGPVSEVLAAYSGQQAQVRLESAADLPRAAEILRGAGATVAERPDHLLVSGVDQPSWITRTLAEQGVYLAGLTPVVADLESVFLELTGTGAASGAPRQVSDPPPDPAVGAVSGSASAQDGGTAA